MAITAVNMKEKLWKSRRGMNKSIGCRFHIAELTIKGDNLNGYTRKRNGTGRYL